MTMQANDFVFYNEGKFVLVAIEKEKSVISSANFNLPANIFETACYRGYVADYFIENNFLFGVKYIRGQESPKQRLSYTGSMVIAFSRREDMSAQFVDDYLDFDKAFELYFIDGELVEIIDLSFAINEWKDNLKDWKLKYDFATKKLQYEYDEYKYTWER